MNNDKIRRLPARTLVLFIATVGVLLFLANGVPADAPQWNIIKPSTTGVPGEELSLMRLDANGNLWVGGRWYFWGESALAMLSADQLGYDALPGGGFDTGSWKVWSSVHHPIPSQYFYDLQFGSDGTAWLASEGGLTRFRPDATDPAAMWHTFTTANSPLIRNKVLSIAVDPQGYIWVVNTDPNFAGGALFKLDPVTNQWTQVPIQASGGSPKIPWSVTIGNEGKILVSLRTAGGFAELNGAKWVVHDSEGSFGSLLQDSDGNVWGASGTSGLWKWNGSTWQNWPELGGTFTITGLGRDRDGVVYVLCWYGPVYKMINNNPVLFADAGSVPSSFIGLPNGEIYINNYGSTALIGTVRHYSASGQLLERFTTHNAGLHDYLIERITRDSLGNMWFACGESGLTRMLGSDGASTAATHWRNWGNHNLGSEPYPWVGNEPMYSLMEDAGGIFWMGGNGVGRWNSTTGQFTNFWNWQNSNIDASGVYAIAKRNGTVWIGTGGSGVLWLNAVTQQWTKVPLSDPWNYSSNNVKAMTADTEGNLWVASEFGLRKFASGNNATFTLYLSDTSPLPNSHVLDVEADPSGGVWIATTAGLARFNAGTWTIYNQQNSGMPGTAVYDVARRPSDGLIAIASNQPGTFPYTGGVSTFDGQNWTHYTTANSPLTHWQVVAVEFDGNGNLWASPISEGLVQIMIGNAATHRSPFDFDGDAKTDIGIFRPGTAEWWINRSSTGTTFATQFGAAADKLVPADFTGDGKSDIATWRPATGEWFVLRSEDSSYYAIPFGTNGDVPTPADYDADGRADIAVYRPSNSTWFIQRLAGGTRIEQFGASGDQPVVSDYDGDGKADIAIFRPGAGEWWISRSTSGIAAFQFGAGSDKLVPGDYTGDGKADAAFFRPSSGFWYILRSEDFSYYARPFGQNGDVPAPGDYDGDGKFDVAVFRQPGSTWYADRSTAGILITQFGTAGDQPIPNAFVR